MNTQTTGIPCSKETLADFFKLMGLDFECLMQTKEGRSKIQDIVYLAEIHGIDLGYQFHWYSGIRGS